MQVYEDGVEPYMAGEMGTSEAYDACIEPMRTFMLQNTSRDDLASAMRLGRIERPDTLQDIPTPVVLTGFLLSELRTALVIGIKVYIPFVMVDVVVASSLLGMGMMMLPRSWCRCLQAARLCSHGRMELAGRRLGWASMSEALALYYGQAALMEAMMIAGPLLGVALIVGTVISVLQAVTQVQEITLVFVPKIIAVFAVLAFLGGWMLQRAVWFGTMMFEQIPVMSV